MIKSQTRVEEKGSQMIEKLSCHMDLVQILIHQRAGSVSGQIVDELPMTHFVVFLSDGFVTWQQEQKQTENDRKGGQEQAIVVKSCLLWLI